MGLACNRDLSLSIFGISVGVYEKEIEKSVEENAIYRNIDYLAMLTKLGDLQVHTIGMKLQMYFSIRMFLRVTYGVLIVSGVSLII